MKTIYGKCTADRLHQDFEFETEVEDDATPEQIQKALWEAACEKIDISFYQTDEHGCELED